MISVSQRVVVADSVERIVEMNVGGTVVEVRESAPERVQVLSVGVQGPVGTVAENVLSMSASAVAAAESAELLAAQVGSDLDQLVNGLSNAIAYQSGVLSA